MTIWKTIWAELSKPSVGDGWFGWATIALGHVVVGQAFVTLGTDLFPALAVYLIQLAVVLGYVVIKEISDVRKGGSLTDSIVDAGFVALGTFYGADWLPYAAFLAVFFGVALIIRKRLL